MPTIRKLARDDDRSGFTCGDAKLDDFFQRHAGQHQFKRQASVTYLAIEEKKALGFVTVCPGTLNRGDLGPAFRNFPPFPLPVLLLARLGVSTTVQRSGVGGMLLKHGLTLAAEMASSVGCVGVVVDAKANSLLFYEKYGFAMISIATMTTYPRLFLPISAIPRERDNG